MNILGVNGWMNRGHDAAACLIIDGKVVAMAEEERFIRKKYAFDVLPVNAVAYCLQSSKITSEDVDVIAWGWNLPYLHLLHNRKFGYNTKELNELIFPRKYYSRKKKVIPVEFVDHHRAHAASVYCMRNTDEDVAVIVSDGAGEKISTSISIGSHGKIKEVENHSMVSSLGFFYEAACQYIGFSRTQAGKLMGLASHGSLIDAGKFFCLKNNEIETPFQNIRLLAKGVLDWEDEIILEWLKFFESLWGKKSKVKYNYVSFMGKVQPSFVPGQKEKNIAAIIQKEFERIYGWLVKRAISLTGAQNIAVAGGSGLNCSANGAIVENFPNSNFIFQPMANDAGVALGAASLMLPEIPKNLFDSPYLGPYFTEKELRQILNQAKIHFTEPTDILKDTAKEIAEGKVVGWFNGKMEVGPRALGSRSILADSRNKKMHTVVNEIKLREQWRPLAPSVMLDFADQYFSGKTFSPYMLIRNYIYPEYRRNVRAIIHIDGSVRPQFVKEDFNPIYYQLIKHFYGLTGIPMIMNTSFNNNREPIVCTPINAIRTFFETGMDLLVMGPYKVHK